MIAVLSDTHSLLRPEALEALRGCTHILHAGDIGNFDFLEALRAIAPVTAIRGNIDTHGPTAQLPATEAIELNGKLIYMLHSLADLDLNPEAAGIAVVISGHSHKPSVESRNGVLYLNPGSCGPRRFNLPVTIAHLHLDAVPRADIIKLVDS
jgi:hypothetical protein